MTDREKLMKLLADGQACPGERNPFDKDCDCCRYQESKNCFLEKLADYLIANGVEIYNAEDEKVLKMARQRTMEAHGDLRYLQGVQFGVESATKHGRWITEYWKSGYIKRCGCSLCGASPKDAYKPDNYCPDCGAKMDGTKDG